MTIHAIYENGVFKPLEQVNLAEHTRVVITPEQSTTTVPALSDEAREKIFAILRERVSDPNSPGNLAERHNEHQP